MKLVSNNSLIAVSVANNAVVSPSLTKLSKKGAASLDGLAVSCGISGLHDLGVKMIVELKDRICGMVLSPETAQYFVVKNNRKYLFCSESCSSYFASKKSKGF